MRDRISLCLLVLIFAGLGNIYGQTSQPAKTKPAPNLIIIGDGGDGGGGGNPGLPFCNTLATPSIQWTSAGPDLSAGWTDVGANTYTLFYRPAGTGNFVAGCGGSTSCTIVAPPTGVTYELYVEATRECQTPGAGQSTDIRDTNIFALTLPISTPTGLNSTSVTPNSFTANWGAANATTNYQIDVNTSSAFNGTAILSAANNGTAQNRNVTGLLSGTTYYYRVRAGNSTGTSAWSQVASVTTAPLPMPAIPTNLTKGTVLTNSIGLSWTAATWASNYLVDLSTLSDFSSFVFSNVSVTVPNITFTGLNPGVTYFARVRASNATGTSGNSVSLTAATFTLAPTNLAQTNVTASSFRLTWAAVTGASNYGVDVSTSSTFSSFVLNNSTVSSGTSIDVTGLTAGTTYFTRARANGAAGASANATLSFPIVPAVPTGLSFTSPTVSSLTATWQSVTGADHYFVDVATNSSFATGTIVKSNVDAGSTAQTNITGLTNNTTYFFRVRASNSAGTSPNSASATVSTLAMPVPSTPSLVAGTLAGDSFTISWPGVNGATNYAVDLSTTSTFDASTTSNMFFTTPTGFFTSLSQGTVYYCRVRANGSGGLSAPSQSLSVTTLLNAPTNVATTLRTTTSFRATWLANAAATEYRIDVSTDNTFATINIVANQSTTNAQYDVSGLTAGTTYFFRVRAMKGSIVSSNTTSSVLLPPLAPTGLTASSPTLSSFVANWQAVSGTVSHYFVDISENPGFNPILLLGIDAQLATQKTITGLTNGKTYYFRVRSTNSGGISVSNSATVTLQAMSVPTDLLTSSITSTSFKLFWSPTSGATSYEANVSADSTFANVTTSNPTTDSTTFTGLTAGTHYYCRVRAVGVGGPSAWSERLDVITSPVIATASTLPHSFVVTSTNAGEQAGYYFQVSKSPDFNSFVDPFIGTQPLFSPTFQTYGLDSAQIYYVRASVVKNHVASGYSNTLTVKADYPDGTVFRIGPGDSAQDPFNYNILPPSPEAAALAKYADIPVSLYSGTPSVSIPIYELKERSLTLPISLSYHGSGNKVEQVASRTGLGWSLNAGGVVTRVVRGWPDEHPTRGFLFLRTEFSKVSDIITLPNTSETKFETYNMMASDCLDGEPDLFYFNFGGYSGQFMYDWDGNIKILSGNSIKIEPLDRGTGDYFVGWKITVDDGTQYTFSDIETTALSSNFHGVADCDYMKEINQKSMPQSWFLTTISSADALSGIHFEYANYSQFTATDAQQTEIYDLSKFQNGTPLNAGRYTTKTTYSGKSLKRITTTSQQTIIDFADAADSRTDIYSDEDNTTAINTNFPLGRIKVTNAGSRSIVSWDFGYSYATGRLTLESVTESTGTTPKSPYKFTYNGSIPDINSTQIDHWGFYNSNPGGLLPATLVHIPFTPQDQVQLIPGGNRSPSPTRVLEGMLKEITYPTGGKDVLTFEPHDYSFQENEAILVTDSVHNQYGVVGPSNSGEREESVTFTVSKESDLHLSYQFGFGDTRGFGGGTRNPGISLIDNNTGLERFYRIFSIADLPVNRDPLDNSSGGDDILHNIPPGSYTITAFGFFVTFTDEQGTHNTENYASLNVTWVEATGDPRPDIRSGGGVRIKQIVRSFGNGNPDKTTTYDYKMVEANKSKSSGSLLEVAQIYEMFMQYAKVPDIAPNSNGYDLEDRYLRFSRNHTALGTTQGSHVGYSQVTVLEGPNGENGKSIYHYNSPRQITDDISFDIPFPPSQSFDFVRGLLLDETQFNANGDTVRFVKNNYDFPSHDISALKVGWRYPGTAATGTGDNLMARYAAGPYTNTLGYSRLKNMKEKLYSPGVQPIETFTSFLYNENTHKQLVQQSVVNSKGDTLVTSHKYPLDYSSPATPILVLRNAHVDNVPVETVTWKIGTDSQISLLSGVKTDFVVDHGGNTALPQTKYSAKITDPIVTSDPYGTVNALYEPRLIVDNYDNFNNPGISSKPNGKKTGYLWGYNSTLLIAAAENTSSLNMFYEGFEEDGAASVVQQKTGKKSKIISGTYSIPTNRLPATNGDYVLTYWTTDGSAWTYHEKQFNGYTAGLAISTDGVSGFIDEIRLHPKGALMTTYTYEPLVGVTSMTDPANVTTYFEYDDFNRLAFKRDQDRNIIGVFEYGINVEVPFQIPPPTIAAITPASAAIGSSVTITGTGFSGILAENTVTFNGVTAVISSSTGTTLNVVIPTGATTGKIGITVNGASVSSQSDFVVIVPPTVTSVNPAQAAVGSTVTITGANFIPDAPSGLNNTIVVRAKGIGGTETVQLDVNGTIVSTWTMTTSMADYTANTTLTGDIKVRFTNDAAGRDVQVDYIKVNGAIRQAEDQAVNSGFFTNGVCGGAGYSEMLHCSGYIDFGPSDNVVKINGVVATVTSATTTQITAIVPPTATSGKVSVTNNLLAVTGTSTNDFIVNPTIASFAPLNGVAGSTVTITGTNFSNTLANNVVKFNGVAATLTAATPTQLTATVPTGVTTGKISVTVDGATTTSATNFTLPPTITSFTPNQGGSNSTVTITGTNFITAPAGGSTITVRAKGRGIEDGETIRLDVNNTPVATWTLTASMQNYTATTTLTGNIRVNFTNDDAGRDVQVDYIIVNGILRQAENQPVNTGVRVNGVCGGSNSELLQCNGYIDFGNMISDNVVKFNGVAATVSSSTATQLSAVVPSIATSGQISVTVNGSVAASASSFTVTTPVVTSMSPAFGPVGSPVTLLGTNFGATPADNVVTFNGVAATVTSASATSLTVLVPATATTGVVSVTTGGKTVSAPGTFEVLIDIPRNGLVAFYKLSGNANDASGNNLNGTMFGGPVASADRFGNPSGAVQFDGIDDYISMGNPAPLRISNTITVSGWINIAQFRTPQNPGTNATIIRKMYNDPTQGNNPTNGWILSQSFTGSGSPSFDEVTLSTTGTTTTSFTSAYVGNTITTSSWIFFTMVIDGAQLRFYQNGVLAGTMSSSIPGDPTILKDGSLGDLLISSQPAFTFKGIVDDVAIYNRALSQTEITQLYQQTITKF